MRRRIRNVGGGGVLTESPLTSVGVVQPAHIDAVDLLHFAGTEGQVSLRGWLLGCAECRIPESRQTGGRNHFLNKRKGPVRRACHSSMAVQCSATDDAAEEARSRQHENEPVRAGSKVVVVARQQRPVAAATLMMIAVSQAK